MVNVNNISLSKVHGYGGIEFMITAKLTRTLICVLVPIYSRR